MKPVEVRQHDDGTWYARPYMGTNKVTGKPIRPYKRFPQAETEDEALALAREWVATLKGAAEAGASMRTADLLSRYIDENRSGWAANTEKAYRNCLRTLEPVIGDIDADELRPHLVEAAYNVLLIRGKVNGEALSQASVRQAHEFLSGAFKWMVHVEAVPFNPMPSVRKPRLDRAEASAIDAGELGRVRELLYAAMDDRSGETHNFERRMVAFAAFVALATGERVGEVCANSLSDAQTGRGTMHVGSTVVEPVGSPPVRQGHTKGRKPRNVSLGERACARIDEHVEWRGTVVPPSADERGAGTLVCTRDGGLMRPSRISRAFRAMLDDAGVARGITFHTLRHTHATELIASGADMRTVQERLGHANVATTLSLYAHVVPGRDRALADMFDERL